MSSRVHMVQDGHSNVAIIASGMVEEGDTILPLTNITAMKPLPSSLRIDKIHFAVEAGINARLFWEGGNLIAPLEGKGSMDFGWMGGVPAPEDDAITGNLVLVMKSTEKRAFMIALDLTKRT